MSVGDRDGRIVRPPRGRTGTVTGRELVQARPQGRVGARRDQPVRSRGRVILVLFAVGLAVLLGGSTVLGPAVAGAARSLAESNPEALRLPFVASVVRDQLGQELVQPAGRDPTPVRFVVPSGASAREIASALAARGLVKNELAFLYFVYSREVSQNLEAGTYSLSPTMTPDQLVSQLAAGAPRDRRIALQLRAGLRIEQVTAYLQTLPLELDTEEFYRIATRPPSSLIAKHPFLSKLPKGRSLEGYLGAGTFNVLPTIEAPDLMELMLDRWEETIGEAALAEARKAKKDLYQVLTLASIVEKEVTVDAERRLVAGVYQNRLDRPTLLNADPTVFYAYDTIQLRKREFDDWRTYRFWTPQGLSLQHIALTPDLQGFQTYQQRGLPPWPICSPSLASIRAALNPDTRRGYFYFVSKNDGTHAFARTYPEHRKNVQLYQGQ